MISMAANIENKNAWLLIMELMAGTNILDKIIAWDMS